MAEKKDFDKVPRDYEELYRHYVKTDANGQSIVRTLIRKIMPHVTEEEMDTLAQDVFTRCLDKKVLEVFDPTKANFGGAIYFVTRTICANHLDRKSRDPVTGLNAGTIVEEQEDTETLRPGTYSLDRLFSATRGVDSVVEAQELVARLVRFAELMGERAANVRDKNLSALIRLLAEGNTPQECAAELKVSQTTVTNWIGYLAKYVREWS